ncbi:MAG TPA: FAD-binding dehydrogenase [Cytophagales bacterium]|jgi:predicted oxidoreductase|nr:FAD-binding dehydrogenase [Cytophagales bacterium]
MDTKTYQTDVAVVGGGIAGIVTTLSLLDQQKKVLIIDRDEPDKFGGLAKESFGGIFFVDSKHQRKLGIHDNVDLAKKDWFSFAEFGENDDLPKQWAQDYIENCTEHVYHYLLNKGIKFFPVVHWVERGLYQPGNSVPRFHMVWGTGYELARVMIHHLKNHPNSNLLNIEFRHKVTDITSAGGKVIGVCGIIEKEEQPFEVKAEKVVLAAGGISGNIDFLKQNWYNPWGKPPEKILNGSHQYADATIHKAAQKQNGKLTHLDRLWMYAAGVHHPSPNKTNHGLSIVPPKSALWVDYSGKRFGPMPLVSAYDTRYLVEQVCKSGYSYSWQIMNWKIAKKELAISGSEFNDAIRDKKILPFLLNILFGNKKLVRNLTTNCVDFVTANSIEELADKMNALNGNDKVDVDALKASIRQYDATIDRGRKYFNDEQLRRIAHLRQYRGDRVRTCKFQKIDDPKTYPLIAVREFVLSRKSLGGLQTNLNCQVMSETDHEPIPNLYAVGETAGFGGGGIHGLRSLEGTFLGTCIYTAQKAANHISGKQ